MHGRSRIESCSDSSASFASTSGQSSSAAAALLDPPRGPGLVWKIPIVDQLVKVDLRTITLNIPPQEVITKDNVPVRVNAVAYFKIVDPKERDRPGRELHGRDLPDRADDAARRCSASTSLDELLSEREKINAILQGIIDEATGPWGIKVSIVEVKDVEIPSGMQRAMARQAEAERERRAKIINSEGEFQAAERLKDAARRDRGASDRAAAPLSADAARDQRHARRRRSSSRRRSTSSSPSSTGRAERLIARVAAAARAGSRSRGSNSGWSPSRSRRIARIPTARAPSMSSAIMSPTITASAGSTSSRSRTARKIEACGFVRPWWKELMPASTSRPWWRANSRTSRAELETSPIRRPGGAHRGERIRHVVVELEVLVPLPAARDLDRAVVRGVGLAAHPADDPLGEAEPDLVVVLELGMATEVDEGGVARRLVAGGSSVSPWRAPARTYPSGPSSGPGRASVKSTSKRTAFRGAIRPSRGGIRQKPVVGSHDQAIVWAIVQPRARSRSRPSSAQRRSSR